MTQLEPRTARRPPGRRRPGRSTVNLKFSALRSVPAPAPGTLPRTRLSASDSEPRRDAGPTVTAPVKASAVVTRSAGPRNGSGFKLAARSRAAIYDMMIYHHRN